MILHPVTIDRPRVEELIDNDDWGMQQKYDGVRCLVRCRAGRLEAVGRRGNLPHQFGRLADAFRTDIGDYWLDGELAYGRFYPFDELTKPRHPYSERLGRCARLVGLFADDRVRQVRNASRKRSTFQRAQAQRVEGVIFRRLDAPHAAGDNADMCVRHKFTKRADVVVGGMSPGRDSFLGGLFDDAGQSVKVGRCPLPGQAKLAAVRAALGRRGDGNVVAEVKYLYATDRHQLYQPVFIRVRRDKRAADCSLDQLVGTYCGEIDGEALARHGGKQRSKE